MYNVFGVVRRPQIKNGLATGLTIEGNATKSRKNTDLLVKIYIYIYQICYCNYPVPLELMEEIIEPGTAV